jgi:hypothetical protein
MNPIGVRADQIEKEIIAGFEDDATDVLSAIISYLQEIQKGEHEEIAECLYLAIDTAINSSFADRYIPMTRVITSAIRWQSEQIAAEEEKLTRPTP